MLCSVGLQKIFETLDQKPYVDAELADFSRIHHGFVITKPDKFKKRNGNALLAVNYQKVITEGLHVYENHVRDLKAKLDLTQPDSINKNIFYTAVLIVLDAVRNFALRYPKLAADSFREESRRPQTFDLPLD